MKITEYIQTMKNVVGETHSFTELLTKAKELSFSGKEEVIEHFGNIFFKEKDDLIIVKYDSKKMFKLKWTPFYMESRGHVIDWKKNIVVLHPFDKFFELDEHSTTSLKQVRKAYSTSKCFEVTDKIDGSLINVRYYQGEMVVASSGSLEGIHVDIANRFLEKNIELYDFIKEHSNYTFMFEMRNTEYPQLIRYQKNDLNLIGMRNMSTHALLYHSEMKNFLKGTLIQLVETENKTIDEMLEFLDSPTVFEKEGFIVRIDDLLVKFKTKNFILATRFKGEPTRNFNVLVEAFNEGRVNALRHLVSKDYLDSFEQGVKLFEHYLKSKNEFLDPMYNKYSHLEKDEFVKEVQKNYFNYAKVLIQRYIGKTSLLDGQDIKFLKQFSEKLTCVSHNKYAELNDIPLEKVLSDIKSGKLKYLTSFKSNQNPNEMIYIIHKWQFLNVENVKYNQ